ncbi:MAG: DUF4089 domain-containing protein [Pseudomonadota bacterium]
MTDKSLSPASDALVEAFAETLGLSIDEATRPAVRANLETALRLAESLEGVGYEAAPVFRP